MDSDTKGRVKMARVRKTQTKEEAKLLIEL